MVAEASIRLRILKVPGMKLRLLDQYRGRGIDLFEDSESSRQCLLASYFCGGRGIDPFEDSERRYFPDRSASRRSGRGIDPFEDSERRELEVAGWIVILVAEASIRLRILKGRKYALMCQR